MSAAPLYRAMGGLPNIKESLPVAVLVAAVVITSCSGAAEPANRGVAATIPVSAEPTTSTSTTGRPSTSTPPALSIVPTSRPTTTLAVWTAVFLEVEYRGDPVDVGHPRFDYQSTHGSSVVTGAWYAADDAYLIIGLNGRFYHYCRVPATIWSGFTATTSFGRYYNEVLRGSYDCRAGGVPAYDGS